MEPDEMRVPRMLIMMLLLLAAACSTVDANCAHCGDCGWILTGVIVPRVIDDNRPAEAVLESCDGWIRCHQCERGRQREQWGPPQPSNAITK